MQSIKLLHIGDVHYPDRNSVSSVDWKDKAVDASLVRQLTPDPYKNVADAIRSMLLDDNLIKGVLISGDLTSRGDIAGYGECIAFFKRVLDLGNVDVWRDKIIAIVPGNHDVPRDDVDPADIFRKFQRTTQAWETVLPGVFLPQTVRQVDILHLDSCSIRVIALNTCIGCGEKRYLPEQIRDELHALLARHSSSPIAPKDFELIGEQLDTPAILEEHLATVEHTIQSLAQAGVAIVLGHHALLPQARVRIDLYTELVNGGRFRNALATLGANVLYVHGHLHEDPVEIISHPTIQKGRLIVVSAPLFQDGFNVIEIFFEDGGQPIGCKIHPYRMQPFGSVRRVPAIRIPLQSVGHSGALCDDESLAILKALDRETVRFKDLAKRVPDLDDAILAEKLQFLEWLLLVDIRDRHEPPIYWHITRIGL